MGRANDVTLSVWSNVNCRKCLVPREHAQKAAFSFNELEKWRHSGISSYNVLKNLQFHL